MGTVNLLPVPVDGDDGVLPFASRAHAGALLGRRFAAHRGSHPLVLGIPKGGVAVAAGVATALDGELDVVIARELRTAADPAIVFGAVTPDGTREVSDAAATAAGVTVEALTAIARAEQCEARRREERYRGARRPPRVRGRVVIVVADGAATPDALRAALHMIRRQHPAHLAVGVPVASQESCVAVAELADEVVCLAQPVPFHGVGPHYWSFPQMEDREVDDLLAEALARA